MAPSKPRGRTAASRSAVAGSCARRCSTIALNLPVARMQLSVNITMNMGRTDNVDHKSQAGEGGPSLPAVAVQLLLLVCALKVLTLEFYMTSILDKAHAQLVWSHLTTAPLANSDGSAAPYQAGNVRSLVPISRIAAFGAFAAEGVPPLRSSHSRWPD